MTRRERNRLADQLKTCEALVASGIQRLESDVRATPGWLRDIQSDLEDAERIVAVVAQDIAS